MGGDDGKRRLAFPLILLVLPGPFHKLHNGAAARSPVSPRAESILGELPHCHDPFDRDPLPAAPTSAASVPAEIPLASVEHAAAPPSRAVRGDSKNASPGAACGRR